MNAIYYIPCSDFDHEYIGQIKLQFGTSLKEHQEAVLFCNKESSTFSEHTCITNCIVG